jgi:hypothetical protein
VKEFSSKASAEDVNPLKDFGFKLDGHEFRCDGHLSVLDLSDLARRVGAASGLSEEELQGNPEAMAAAVSSMSESLLMAMGSAEYERFRKHVRAQRTPDRVTIEIMQMINEQIQSAVEEQAGRPTGPSSPPSTGPAETGERIARVMSFQSGDVQVVPPPQDHRQPKAQGTARPSKTKLARSGQRAAG